MLIMNNHPLSLCDHAKNMFATADELEVICGKAREFFSHVGSRKENLGEQERLECSDVFAGGGIELSCDHRGPASTRIWRRYVHSTSGMNDVLQCNVDDHKSRSLCYACSGERHDPHSKRAIPRSSS